tara:strand:+ start:237 stop:746 length:510 start_codon:yes stop_codon:yes gene_type:complete
MRYRRLYVPGGSYFFTIVLMNRKSTLLVDNIDKLKSAFKKVKTNHPFKIDAIVILPDHLHMVIALPEEDMAYSKRLGLIKSYFTRGIKAGEVVAQSREKKRERGIWQRRFWEHSIRDEKDFIRHVHYIHYNPVKHGYVKSPVNWKFSSIHRYVRKGLLPADWSADVDVF